RDDDVSVARARNGSTHEQEPALGIDARDLEILDGAGDRAEVTRHALAGEHAARILRHADRPRNVVRTRVAVRGTARSEVVALDRSGEALADRGALHVDLLAGREHVDLQLGAWRELAEGVGRRDELAHAGACLDAR